MGLGPTGVSAVCSAAIAGVLTLWACGEDQANDAGSGNTTSGAAAGGAGGSGGATTTQGGGPVVDPKPNSQSCDQDAECQSGHCSPDDGVCCDSACDETCVACLQEKTGLPNGTCAPVLRDTNSDDKSSELSVGCTELGCGDSAAA